MHGERYFNFIQRQKFLKVYVNGIGESEVSKIANGGYNFLQIKSVSEVWLPTQSLNRKKAATRWRRFSS